MEYVMGGLEKLEKAICKSISPSTPSTAVAIALPCSATFSILEIASQRNGSVQHGNDHTTGRFLTLPVHESHMSKNKSKRQDRRGS